jgi:hypothetical protein
MTSCPGRSPGAVLVTPWTRFHSPSGNRFPERPRQYAITLSTLTGKSFSLPAGEARPTGDGERRWSAAARAMIPGLALVRPWTLRAQRLRFGWAVCVLATMSGCGGETSDSDGGTRQDGGRVDATVDAPIREVNTPDLSMSDVVDAPDEVEDGGAPVDANFGDVHVAPPALDAATFDGCTPDPCSGEVCIDFINGTGDNVEYSNCGSISGGCEPDPTCLCIVESYYPWCLAPVCKKEGAQFQVNCKLGPHP